MGEKKTGKRIKMEEGFLPILCPKCGKEMLECPQTLAHDKNRQTEAVVYECSDNPRCEGLVIVTTKRVGIRKVKPTTDTISGWPPVKPKDLDH